MGLDGLDDRRQIKKGGGSTYREVQLSITRYAKRRSTNILNRTANFWRTRQISSWYMVSDFGRE